MKARILLIEGRKSDHPSFSGGLTRKGFQCEEVYSGNEALTRLQGNMPDLVLIDAASMQTSGRRICQSVRDHADGTPILLIIPGNTPNSARTGADVVLVWPFTLQKLLNRIKPYLPSEQKNLLQVGPFTLDSDQRWVRCQGKQSRLTPRLVLLLRTLMEKPGEVIERTDLFRQVWDTTYTADTRTLDVHISWLREALEIDPRHPLYIKTVRGVGYRLDID